ncbi:MAG TPA: hypothetical protein VFR37_07485 [Longimicrobium sp.]|nr:hypothetical protein [Longimicrobium sp.]
MKVKRFFLAAAIAMAVAACSRDVTGPEPAALTPAAPSGSTAPAPELEAEVPEVVPEGTLGSGG